MKYKKKEIKESIPFTNAREKKKKNKISMNKLT